MELCLCVSPRAFKPADLSVYHNLCSNIHLMHYGCSGPPKGSWTVRKQRLGEMWREGKGEWADTEKKVLNTMKRRENWLPKHYHRGRVFLPWTCWIKSHHYVDFSFGNSCISLFQRYFFLIYLIPQERSISGPWHWLPSLTLRPKRLSSYTHVHRHTHTYAHLLSKRNWNTDHHSRSL